MASISVLKAFDQLGRLRATVDFDEATQKFVMRDADGHTLSGEFRAFARLLIYARLDEAQKPLPAHKNSRPWLVLDVVRAGTPTKPASRFFLDSADQELKINCLVRCLVKRDDRGKATVRFDFTLDKEFILGKSIKFARILSDDKLIGQEHSPLKLASFKKDFRAEKDLTDEIEDKNEAPLLSKILGLAHVQREGNNQLHTFGVSFGEPGDKQHTDPLLTFKRDVLLIKPDTLDPSRNCQGQSRELPEINVPLPNTTRLTLIQRQESQPAMQAQLAEFGGVAPPPGQWVISVIKLPFSSVLSTWNEQFLTSYCRALHTVLDGRPISGVPRLEATRSDTKNINDQWALALDLWDRNPEEVPQEFLLADGFLDNKVTLRPRAFSAPAKAQTVQVSLPEMRDHDGQALQLRASLYKPSDVSVDNSTAAFQFRLVFQKGATSTAPQVVRMGAIDVEFSPAQGLEDPPANSGIAFEIKASWRQRLPALHLEGYVPALGMRPGGQDDLPGEEFEPLGELLNDTAEENKIETGFRRERPLIIEYPLPLFQALGGVTAKVSDDRKLHLYVLEDTARGVSQKVQMRLQLLSPSIGTITTALSGSGSEAGSSSEVGLSSSFSTSENNNAGIGALKVGTDAPAEIKSSVLILDRHPFLVARVDVPPLLPTAGGSEIGNWSNAGFEGANWELIGSTQGFQLWLPPQAVGEAMEKGRLPAFDDVAESAAADFRFSPPSRLQLLPSYFKQRFAEAPWNLRRILGYPGQRAPGAGIVDLRFELLYGLTCHVEYPFLRLAQLDARLGAPPGRLPEKLAWQGTPMQERAFHNFRQRWSEQFQQHLSRLSLLEPWDANQPLDKDGDPLPLSLKSDLGYRLRPTAHLRYPVSNERVKDNDVRRFQAPHSPDGLAGGASWGFESSNVYDSLREGSEDVPQTTGAELNNPYFSALGGWGHQKAVFQNGLTTIHAHTAMGRVHSYSVERLGRISQSWNRAKHVIVYERSMTASPQFFITQDPNAGRPLLRKVREYIEILQPRRTYPEKGKTLVERGFTQACTFHSTIINVDSSWGGEVGQIGWQVPLWRSRQLFQTLLQTADEDADLPNGNYRALMILLRDSLSGFGRHLRSCLQTTLEKEPNGAELETLFLQLKLNTTTSDLYKKLREIVVLVLNERLQDRGDDASGVSSSVKHDQTLFSEIRLRALRRDGVIFSSEAEALLQTQPTGDERVVLNRILLEDFFLHLGPAIFPLENLPATLPISTLRVYPKPLVALELASDPASGAPMELVGIDEPQKLRFFTLTHLRSGESVIPNRNPNTDEWDAIAGIDYPDLPTPRPPAIAAGDARDLDRPLPPAPAFEPGYGAFTWALSPHSRPVNLVSERATQAVGTRVRNVTLLRAVPAAAGTAGDKLRTLSLKAGQLHDQLRLTLDATLAKLPHTGSLSDELKAEIDNALKQATQQAKDDVTTVTGAIAGLPGAVFPRSPAQICDEISRRGKEALSQSRTRLITALDNTANEIDSALSTLKIPTTELQVAAHTIVDNQFDTLEIIATSLNTGLEDLVRAVETAQQALREARGRVEAEITAQQRHMEQIERAMQAALTPPDLAALKDMVRLWREALEGALVRLRAALDEAESRGVRLLQGELGQIAKPLRDKLHKLRDEIEIKLGKLKELLETLLALLERGVQAGDAEIKAAFNKAKTAWQEWRDGMRAGCEQLITDLDTQAATLTKTVNDALAALRDAQSKLSIVPIVLKALRAAVKKAIDDELKKPEATLESVRAAIKTAIQTQGRDAINTLIQKVEANLAAGTAFCTELQKLLSDEVAQIGADLAAELDQLAAEIKKGLDEGSAQARRAINQAMRRAEQVLDPYAEQARGALRKTLKDVPLFQKGDSLLHLVRAYADAPTVPGLAFNREQIGCFFDGAGPIQLTPIVALANRAGDDLKALGIRLPTTQLLDRFIPALPTDFDVSRLLPDFAGLKLSNLLPNLKVPSGGGDKVKVTHGIDHQSRRAWLKASIDLKIDQPSTLFSFGPVTLVLHDARFNAVAEIVATPGAPPRQKASGFILGNWEMQLGGKTLVTFARTRLTFDENGKLNFDLAADRVLLTSPLNFLSELMRKLNFSDDGFSINVIEINGIPCGIESALVLPLPDVQAGAFGIANLKLAAFFRLLVAPSPDGVDFSISVGLALASKDKPFVIVIFILGGGGWLETTATYHPLKGAIESHTTIGLSATARLAFSLGTLSGGVGIDVSLSAELHAATGHGGSLHILFTILIWGEVRVLSFVSVSLRLMLEAEYRNGALIGRGSVEIKIKICWCFTFSFKAAVEYKIAGSAGGSKTLAAPAPGAAPAALAAPALGSAAASGLATLDNSNTSAVPINAPSIIASQSASERAAAERAALLPLPPHARLLDDIGISAAQAYLDSFEEF